MTLETTLQKIKKNTTKIITNPLTKTLLAIALTTTIPKTSKAEEINIAITTPYSIEWNNTTIEDIQIDTTINGKATLTITDSTTQEPIYTDTFNIQQGQTTIYIPPQYQIKEKQQQKTLTIKNKEIINNTKQNLEAKIYNTLGQLIKTQTLQPGPNPLPTLNTGTYIIYTEKETYKLQTINNTAINTTTQQQKQPKTTYTLKQIAGERNPNIQIQLQFTDTNYHTQNIYPYYTNEQLTNKKILITLTPKTITIYNPYTQDTTTIQITRTNLLEKMMNENPDEQQNKTYIEGWYKPITTIYLQGNDTTLINKAKHITQTYQQYIDTILTSNNLTIYTPPTIKNKPNIKDTTGIGNQYEVPPYTIVIRMESGGAGTRAWSYDIADINQAYAYYKTGYGDTPIWYYAKEALGLQWAAHDCSDPESLFNPYTSDTIPTLRDITDAIMAQIQKTLNYLTNIKDTISTINPTLQGYEFYETIHSIQETTKTDTIKTIIHKAKTLIDHLTKKQSKKYITKPQYTTNHTPTIKQETSTTKPQEYETPQPYFYTH